MNKFLQACTIAIAFSAITTSAQATIYEYSIDNPSGNDKGGKIHNITTSYNDINQQFSWEYTINEKNDGFWLVISNGPNPKGINNQLAILYGDLNNGVLSAYQYNGVNGPNSYYYEEEGIKKPNKLLQQWDNAFTTTINDNKKTAAFSIDVSDLNKALNSPDWEGIRFGKQIGIWFHPSKDSKFTYYEKADISNSDTNIASQDSEGRQIESFRHRGAGWHDSGNLLVTNVIPVPSALLLLGLGLFSMIYIRCKKAA